MPGTMRVGSPIIAADTMLTNAFGVARLYLTEDGTVTGDPIFHNVFGCNIGIESPTPTSYRMTISGISYVEVTVTRQQFTGVILLGIPLLCSVSDVPVAGANVKFTVLGD